MQDKNMIQFKFWLTAMSNTQRITTETGSYLGSFWMVLAAFGFTVMGVLVKLCADRFLMHGHELVFWRVAFAALVLGVQALLLGRDFKTAHPKAHFWRSLSGSISLLMFFYAIAHLPLATAVTFSHTSAIFLAILSAVILGQRPNKITWVALIFGFFGIVLLLRPTLLSGQWFASVIGIGGGALAGYAYLQVRELSLVGEPSWRIVFYFSLLSSIVSAFVSTWVGWTPIKGEMLIYLFGIGLSAVVAQIAMTHAYKVGRKFMVAGLGYLVVVFSALYGVLVFDEVLPLMAWLGIGCIVVSGLLAGKK